MKIWNRINNSDRKKLQRGIVRRMIRGFMEELDEKKRIYMTVIKL